MVKKYTGVTVGGLLVLSLLVVSVNASDGSHALASGSQDREEIQDGTKSSWVPGWFPTWKSCGGVAGGIALWVGRSWAVSHLKSHVSSDTLDYVNKGSGVILAGGSGLAAVKWYTSSDENEVLKQENAKLKELAIRSQAALQQVRTRSGQSLSPL